MPDRPNVLLICTDQQSADAMGCVRERLDTPAMDSITERGVRFEETYCANPLCGPSRASIFTGRMPHEHGVLDNGIEIDPAYREESLGHLLSGAGYDCGYAGEWHVPDHDIGEGHGFEQLCGYDDHLVPGAVVDFFRRDRDRPFFAVASFDNPHNICEWARGQNLPQGPIEDAPTEECPSLPANFPAAPFEPDVIHDWREGLDAGGPTEDTGFDAEDWRQYRHAYDRLVEKVDEGIGAVLDALDAAGHREDTVVIFTSDHGDMQGAHRLQQKHFTYEESVRVPFVVDAPDGESGAVDDDHLVSNGLDIVPTICDYAGVEPPADLLGASVRPLVADGAGDGAGESGDAAAVDEDWRDVLVVQSQKVGARMVRTADYKYAVYDQGRPREQLFDMERDRGEMVNLAVDADYADVLDAHREHLLEWCVETGDVYDEHYARKGMATIPGYEYAELAEQFDG